MQSTAASSTPSARAIRLPRVTADALALGAMATVGLHVVDDSFIQPEPGTSAVDHPGGLVSLALLGIAGAAYHRGRAGLRATIAIVTGLLALVFAATSAGHTTVTVGPSGDDYTGLLLLPAGLVLIGVGIATLWQSRKLNDSRRWRYTRRGLITVAAAIASTSSSSRSDSAT